MMYETYVWEVLFASSANLLVYQHSVARSKEYINEEI